MCETQDDINYRRECIAWWHNLDEDVRNKFFTYYAHWVPFSPAKNPDELTGREIELIRSII